MSAVWRLSFIASMPGVRDSSCRVDDDDDAMRRAVNDERNDDKREDDDEEG